MTSEPKMKIVMPQLDLEAMEAASFKRYEDASSNPTAFMSWFPAVLDLGIPSPETRVVQVPYELQRAITSIESEEAEKDVIARMRPYADAVRAFAKEHGYPVFIRNSLFSGKHSWRNTCYVASADANIERQIIGIFYEWAMVNWAEMARDLVIRKFIPTHSPFTAFEGFPVNQEFRIFARDGVVEGYQPYWPAGAVADGRPSIAEWQGPLAELHKCPPELMARIQRYAAEVTFKLGGYWSVDFLIDVDGNPWLIDMAEGSRSYRCKEGYCDLRDEGNRNG